ncbi:hypothetical protein GQ457_14G010540 [Hibiscus cannabinus]
MLLPPSTLLRHGSTYVATVLNIAKAWKHSNVITTFSKSHLMHVMKTRFKGTTYLHRPCAVTVGVLSPSSGAASMRLLGHSSLSSCRTRRCPRLYGHNHENQILIIQGHHVYWTASKARMCLIVHCNCATAVNVCCCILGDRRPT